MQAINETAASVLGFLSLRPMTGWDLYELAQASVGNFWSMTKSQVYRELQAMADAGLVQAEALGSRNKRRYRLTPKGEDALRSWLLEAPVRSTSREPFLVKLFFADHLSPVEVEAMAAGARIEHERNLETYQAAIGKAEKLSPFAAATARYGVAVERAVLAWFDEAPWRTKRRRRPSS